MKSPKENGQFIKINFKVKDNRKLGNFLDCGLQYAAKNENLKVSHFLERKNQSKQIFFCSLRGKLNEKTKNLLKT